MDIKSMVCAAACMICSLAAVVYGLGAVHVDVLAQLQLAQFDMYLRYVVGAAGVVSLLLSMVSCSSKC